jgi:hypothetical protein
MDVDNAEASAGAHRMLSDTPDMLPTQDSRELFREAINIQRLAQEAVKAFFPCDIHFVHMHGVSRNRHIAKA